MRTYRFWGSVTDEKTLNLKGTPTKMSIGSKATVPAVCKNCSAPFQARKHTRLNKPAEFCSRQCFHGHVKATGRFKGTKSWHWQGGVSLPTTENNMRYRRRQIAKSPEKERARMLAGVAIQSGKLVREPCSACGNKSVKTEAHHDDYSKPLEVRWLCPPCHDAHHAEERRRARMAAREKKGRRR